MTRNSKLDHQRDDVVAVHIQLILTPVAQVRSHISQIKSHINTLHHRDPSSLYLQNQQKLKVPRVNMKIYLILKNSPFHINVYFIIVL